MIGTLEEKAPRIVRAAVRTKARCGPIVGFCTVRTEGDIIEEALHAFARQLDLLLVIDCGSEDDTTERVAEVCRRHQHVVALGSVGPRHARQVRRDIFAKFHRHLPADAWWMVADADEFVEDNLHEKVAAAQSEMADHIFSAHVNFYYTANEHEAWLAGQETVFDRARPIQERRRFYRMQTSQRRLFRNLPWLRWNLEESFPENLSAPASERIIFRHYQYRDPLQIRERIAIRSAIPKEDSAMKENLHWHRTQLEEAISTDKRLQLWEPGQPFIPDPELPQLIHQPKWKSVLKYTAALAHAATHQQKPPRYFHEIDPEQIVRRMR